MALLLGAWPETGRIRQDCKLRFSVLKTSLPALHPCPWLGLQTPLMSLTTRLTLHPAREDFGSRPEGDLASMLTIGGEAQVTRTGAGQVRIKVRAGESATFWPSLQQPEFRTQGFLKKCQVASSRVPFNLRVLSAERDKRICSHRVAGRMGRSCVHTAQHSPRHCWPWSQTRSGLGRVPVGEWDKEAAPRAQAQQSSQDGLSRHQGSAGRCTTPLALTPTKPDSKWIIVYWRLIPSLGL